MFVTIISSISMVFRKYFIELKQRTFQPRQEERLLLVQVFLWELGHEFRVGLLGTVWPVVLLYSARVKRLCR